MLGDQTTAAMDLSTPYKPTAIYYDDADSVEYIRRDAPCVYRRIDWFLTLAFDMYEPKELVGFRLKGFKNFYLREIKPTRGLNADFLSLAVALEKAVGLEAENIMKCDAAREVARQEAYKSAYLMATQDGVSLDELPLKRA